MKRFFESTKSYLRRNILTPITIAIVCFMVVVIGRNLIHAISIGFEIGRIEQEQEQHRWQITRDSMLLESLKDKEGLIRYARERYYMQSEKEEIFVIE